MTFLERPDWHAQANCGRNGILGDDPTKRVAIMFPGPNQLSARWVCDGCPVLDQCAAARDRGARGTWAGTGQRRWLKDDRPDPAPLTIVEPPQVKEKEPDPTPGPEHRVRIYCGTCGQINHWPGCPETKTA